MPWTRLSEERREVVNVIRDSDFIRMLDAEGYPRAFLACNGYRLEFYNAHLEDGQVTAKSAMTVST